VPLHALALLEFFGRRGCLGQVVKNAPGKSGKAAKVSFSATAYDLSRFSRSDVD